MDVRSAVCAVIEHLPGFFGMTRKLTIGVGTEEIVYTQAQIADRIAAVFEDNLRAKGFVVLRLPPVVCDEPGRRYIRVPVTGRPWADGEVRVGPTGDEVAIVDVPARMLVQDVPGFAAALMGAHAAATARPDPAGP